MERERYLDCVKAAWRGNAAAFAWTSLGQHVHKEQWAGRVERAGEERGKRKEERCKEVWHSSSLATSAHEQAWMNGSMNKRKDGDGG